jgi:hypothetical protein
MVAPNGLAVSYAARSFVSQTSTVMTASDEREQQVFLAAEHSTAWVASLRGGQVTRRLHAVRLMEGSWRAGAAGINGDVRIASYHPEIVGRARSV